ncbi:MAG: quinone-interacting membrane-bound oxidoreductase complex subunit QmoC [Terriglobales bacterium]
MTAIQAPVLIRPDREFRNRLMASGGEDLKKCFQCATCSVVCEVSDSTRPFPRKEMAWAQWGLKDRLVADIDIWLCHQCNDCSSRCPRGARPGDVMAAIRREAIGHYSAPRWMAHWANKPRFLTLVLLFPCLLLSLAAWVRGPLERMLGASYSPNRIIISYWSQLPQWLLVAIFAPFVLLEAVIIAIGVTRFWLDLKACDHEDTPAESRLSIGASIRSALRSIILHDKFSKCTAERSRLNSHRLVLFGFAGLLVVDLWVLTARFNPLLRDVFVYPLSFWSPWKILANVAGAAVLIGCTRMISDRMARSRGTDRSNRTSSLFAGTRFDWTFLGLAAAAVFTGFGCEFLHYARVDPLRYAIYFIHLATVFALVVLLPYSKFAHMIYRATAMVYAEHTGRHTRRSP